jgi:acyl-CoA reductase-like NAD-dependent aldehyde dehydrogenase
MRLGSGLDPATTLGPSIDRHARDRIAETVARACELADEVLLVPQIPGGALAGGAFLAPVLVAHADPAAFFCQEEIFGPFLTVEPFENEQEALSKADNTVFGLSASVWTRDIDRAYRVARALRNGTVWINEHNKLFAEAETGGYRQSGLGRLHGYEGLSDFLETKHIYHAPGVTG